MRAVAIVLSFGRPELGELLTQWSQQTRRTPLLVWLDGYGGNVEAPADVRVHHAPQCGPIHTIGGVRAAAVELARSIWNLDPSDGFLVLDDDDFYSRRHAEHTIEALESSESGWTGARRCAYQWQRDMFPPATSFGEWGPGQHATWGLRLDTYDAAGGYSENDRVEDVALANRIGLRQATPHTWLTHVRRQFASGSLSAGNPRSFDRMRLRDQSNIAPSIEPTWRPELDELARWVEKHERDYSQ